jgi:mannose-6-phosphate isomerase
VLTPLRIEPQAKERVWGGTRLGPPRTLRVGELWLAGPWLAVASGPHAGRTLDELARELGVELVGTAAPVGEGPRFPLLAKIIDPAAWLSVQVHPDDATARRLEGPGAVGKAEAWYVLDAAPGAELLLGTRPGVTLEQVRTAVGGGASERGTVIVDLMERITVRPGDAFLVPAGTLHAVGPGLLLYELQQPSDLTYRVDDWGRPATPQRPLHTAQALASLVVRGPARGLGGPGRLVVCPHFTLDALDGPATVDPAGRTLHLVTAAGAPLELAGAGWAEHLGPLETVVVPAAAGPYEMRPGPGGRALLAALP